jgi:hypothetical protein
MPHLAFDGYTESISSLSLPQYNWYTGVESTATGMLLGSSQYKKYPASVKTTATPSGWRPPMGYSGEFKRESVRPAYWAYRNGSGPFNGPRWKSSYGPTAANLAAVEGEAVNEALQRMVNQKVNLAVAWGERAQTIDMIVDRMNKFRRMFDDLKHGRVPRGSSSYAKAFAKLARKGSKDLAGAWLEFRYGWLPLLMDVYGAVEALDALQEQGAYMMTVKAGKTVVAERSVTTGTKYNGIGPGACRHLYNTQREDFAKIRLDYRIDSDYAITMKILGLDNPSVVLWELMPWSFVIDWFISVGDFLQGFSADCGLTFVGGSKTVGSKIIQTAYSVYDSGSEITDPGLLEVGYLKYTRTAYTGTPLPSLHFTPDTQSWKHWLDALGLLRQQFRL